MSKTRLDGEGAIATGAPLDPHFVYSAMETGPASGRPMIVAVDDDPQTRAILVQALRGRYGVDYDIVAFSDPDAALLELERMRETAEVALILANYRMGTQTGTAFLGRTRDTFPTARRLILSVLGDFSALQAVARASALGEFDHYAARPWTPRDEQFLSTVGDVLAEWAREHGRYVPSLRIVGERWDEASQSLRDTLQRWGVPLGFLEAGSSEGARLLVELNMGGALPVVVLPDGRALAQPTISDLVEALGANAEPLSKPFDLAVLGSGPAGLSAAVNAASEGLRVLLVEPSSGQASSSPMIRNYLGFPAGVSGAELMRRGWEQAWMFGVQTLAGRAATAIRANGDERVVFFDDGSEARAKSIVIATGLVHRQIGIPTVDGLVGRGVFYGSSATEAQAMSGEDVIVVGGANAGAEAAVHLARYARTVTVVIRGESAKEGMSDYLVEQLGGLANVELLLNTEIVEARDQHQLRSLALRNNANGSTFDRDATALFILIGAAPLTDWLPTDVARDERGFVLTGSDTPPARARTPIRLSLETTMAGVFAAGDVRHGSVKRLAAAVGEGATAVHQVHEYRSGVASRR